MIRRIILRDFMSHSETVIEPADGLTVLVGPNNSGKSAIVEALRTLCTNENSTHVKRHGARECSVTVETDDGHVIQWTRRNSPSYLVDAQLFDRLGRGRGGVPPELHQALRLPWVEGDGAVFDVHLGEQKDPIFLLGQSGSQAARFFASSSDATKLVEMQRRHREKVRAASGRKQQLEAAATRQTGRLAQLEAVPDLSTRMEAAEAQHRAIAAADVATARLTSEIDGLGEARTAAETLAATARALTGLDSPPSLPNPAPLAGIAVSLGIASRERVRAWAEADAMQHLRRPPELAPEADLEAQIQATARVSTTVRASVAEYQALSTMVTPPTLADSAGMHADLVGLARAETRRGALHAKGDLLSLVAGPPDAQDDIALAATIANMRAAARSVDGLAEAAGLTTALPEAPTAADTLPLSALLADFARVENAVGAHAQALERAETERRSVAEKLRAWAEEHETCPTCGAAVDADALVDHAAGAHGGPRDA